MIKDKIKKEKGISLISLVIAVLVLMILTNIIIYNAKDNLKIGKLKEMKNDIGNLRDKISSFYATNGKIPAKLVYDNEDAIEKIKDAGVISDKVDTGNFLVIDLSALENLTLNRGEDYKKVKELDTLTEEAKKLTDLYIINEASHNIFYVAGITIDGETFYTDYGADEVDKASINLRYVDNVRIPEGFYYVGGSKEEGLVISDVQGDDLDNSKHGNQFVWVPVEKIEDFHRIDGYENGQLQKFLAYFIEPHTNGYTREVEEYEKMKKSVEENKGFYIGRFEAGKDSNENTIVQKNVEVYNNIPWGNSTTDASGGAVEKAKNFIAGKTSYNSSVTSTLCYGVQWDATIQFMDNNYISGNCDTNSYVIDSMGKGWYSDNYVTGNLNHKTGIDIDSNKSNCVKNIYDMAGNVTEWTLERSYRGGHYSVPGKESPSSNRSSNTLNESGSAVGFRIALYLNESEEENWTPVYDKKEIYKDKNGDTAPIPEGFQVSKKNGEDTINGGLVVRDSNLNEFVWIPVDNINDFHTIEGYQSGNRQSELTNCQEPYKNGYSTEVTEYNSMKKSVENNHGFYIGRYEAGIESNGQIIIKKNANAFGGVPWGNSMTDIEGTTNTGGQTGAVKLAKELEKNNNDVTSTLVYGVQWDAALKFIDPNYTGFAKNSSKQGWHSDNLNSTAGGNITINPNRMAGLDLIYSENPNIIANKQKNIYDMAGNLYEWTMEAYKTGRALRGGSYDSNGSVTTVSFRGAYNTPTLISRDIGFRIALYLQL